MVFLMLYLHIAKALYFRSYLPTKNNVHLFFSGILVFFLMMGTAFIGYVLP
jgi:ubiquinol-cytochrome c reductase cytochrome b subunit